MNSTILLTNRKHCSTFTNNSAYYKVTHKNLVDYVWNKPSNCFLHN